MRAFHATRNRFRSTKSHHKPLSVEALEQRQLLTFIDIFPGVESSSPRDLAVVGESVFFNTSDWRNQLWTSDGTLAGTRKIKEGGVATNLKDVDGTLFFLVEVNEPEPTREESGDRQLWKSDGTAQGTVLVKTISEVRNSGCEFDACRGPGRSLAINGKYYFTNHGRHEFSSDLWVSDGTEEGTVLLFESAVYQLIDRDGELFFRVGLDYWKTDGTPAGTVKVVDSQGNRDIFLESQSVLWDGALYFVASSTTTINRELWKVDLSSGVRERIKEFKDLFTEGYEKLSIADDTLYFTLGHGLQLWKSDGTELGTTIVTEFPDRELNGRGLANVNDELFFWAAGENGAQLWKKTPESDDVELVFQFDSKAKRLDKLTDINGTLYFFLEDENAVWRLWQSDGTEVGTKAVEMDGLDVNNLHGLQFANNKIFFSANTEENGRELGVIDLSTDEDLVGDVNADGVFNSADLVAVFQAGEYEDRFTDNSSFEEGDWNGDGEFDSSDLVLAFQLGHYSNEVRLENWMFVESLFSDMKQFSEKDDRREPLDGRI